jgi:peptidyl-dipeptidase Dcp
LNCITNDEDLSGLPEGTIEAARSLKSQEKGWIFTLDYPSYVPFVTYADNRATQEDYCFWRKGFQNNELDNQQNVFKIAKLRFDRAQL